VISAINSLTCRPLSRRNCLKSHDAPKDRLSRLIERAFGWVFGRFNRFFKASSDRYQGSVSRILTRRGVVFAVYAVLLVGTALIFKFRAARLHPTQDKLYLIGVCETAEGASLDVPMPCAEGERHHLHTDGVAHVVSFVGFNRVSTVTPQTTAWPFAT